MFHDTVMSLLVVCVIVALAVIWKYSTPHEDPSSSGWLGKLYDEKADPGTTNFVPRPDWYFYFLFYLLRIFKWPESVILGTVLIPTILVVLLIALPFIDIGRERRPLRRPVAMTAAILVIISMGALTYKGATAKEPLAAENLVLVPQWAAEAGVRRQPDCRGRGEDLRAGRLHELPHVPGCGHVEPRRARPVLDREDVEPRRRGVRGLRLQPVEVRQQRDAAVRRPRGGQPAQARHVPPVLRHV